jgi:hypothetical protein
MSVDWLMLRRRVNSGFGDNSIAGRFDFYKKIGAS